MDNDLRDMSERDQLQASMREYAEKLARDVVAFRKTLVAEGFPDSLADHATERFTDAWMKAHVEAQAGVGVTGFMYAVGDDE